MKKIDLNKITMNRDRRSEVIDAFAQKVSTSVYSFYLNVDRRFTMILPIIHGKIDASLTEKPEHFLKTESAFTPVCKLIKNSGIYAISAAAPPLVALVLAPLLTHHLSLTDYGVLTILNLCISLGAGIFQLGLPSAFFRAYGYDYSSSEDRRDIIATVTTLLCTVSLLMIIGVIVLSSFLAQLLLGRSASGNLVIMAGVVVLLQNLTVPGFAWLRAENRAIFYSLLSVGNLLIALLGNIVLVVVLHLGIAGSLIASGCGYASIVIYMIPRILVRAGVKIRINIARDLLSFGLPLVLNFISYWILQLSDRYLLSLFDSLAQTAIYAVAYAMGSAINILIMGPFTLAWPTAMFTIAKYENSTQVFKIVFRWFSLLLLFLSFGLSLLGSALLDYIFPLTYHSSAQVIPIISISSVFYGIYYVFMIGPNIKRKTWLTAVFTTIAAIVNISFNLILIPHYGVMGAALSTLLAYIALAFAAYIVNQRIYPIPFEINIFIVALIIGIIFYVGSNLLTQIIKVHFSWVIILFAFCLYGGCLTWLIRLPIGSSKNKL